MLSEFKSVRLNLQWNLQVSLQRGDVSKFYQHKRWCVTLDTVAGADPWENGIGNSKLCTFGRDEATDLSHDLKRKVMS